MDKRYGEYLKHISSEYFSEVYKRVQEEARQEYQRLQARVVKAEDGLKLYYKLRGVGYIPAEEEKYKKDLERAKEHLERFIAANADYLI